MTDDHEQSPIQERLESIRDPEQDALAAADRADSERDVSMLAMVGLLILIVGIGMVAWGATTPGFFDSSGGAPISCRADAIDRFPGGENVEQQAVCSANVGGRVVTGTPQNIQALIEEARAGQGPLASAEQRFWIGMVLMLAGVIVTVWGFLRARRAGA